MKARPQLSHGSAFAALALALLFGACTLTSGAFDPPLVERTELVPDASASAPVCATDEECGSGRVCVAAGCVAVEVSDPGPSDAGVAAPCVGSDCTSELPLPLAPTCDDGLSNGDEVGVDCGGSCAGCPTGATCAASAGCESGVCGDAGTCQAPSCEDGVVNADESDRDCGGSCERDCGPGGGCRVDGDCEAGLFCPAVTRACVPVSCGDGVQNGAEVLVDCGGGCAGCPDGSACGAAGDCASGACSAGVCQVPSCDDGATNQGETDIDCGGSCGGCPDGRGCVAGRDCASGVCVAGACATPSCNDGVVNQNETDVDCGGGCFRNCAIGDGCANGGDCQTGVCGAAGCGPGPGTCCQAPTCTDGVDNGSETAVDCGNAACGPCPVGAPCTADAQCALAFCQQGQCRDPGTCVDGAQNGREVGVDCGGGDCPVCGDLSACNQDADCSNNNCDARGICISCGDGVQDGAETGVDCGGTDPACRRCNFGERCGSNDDCNFLLCLAGVCG